MLLIPHILHIVLSEFQLQLPNVVFFGLVDLHLDFTLKPFHLLPVFLSEGSLLILDSFDVSGDPRFVVRETVYSF